MVGGKRPVRNEATALQNRHEFQRNQLTKLASTDVPGRSGKRATRPTSELQGDAMNDTAASYAIFDEQGARKNALDNRR